MASQRSLLQITSYPPPRAGWGVRVEYVKRALEADGHRCVVLNIGSSRAIPSGEYETVLGAWDYVTKVFRYSRQGYVAHIHVNGASPKGFVLTLVAEAVSLITGKRCFLTFHAGVDQLYFPRPKYPALVPVYWLMFTVPRAIICNSAEVKAKIVEYGVSPEKIVPIPAFSRQYLEGDTASLPESLELFYSRFGELIFCYTKVRPLFHPLSLIDGFARLARKRPTVGLVLCGVEGHMEPDLWESLQGRLARPELTGRVLVVDDLSHEAFLHALGRASLYLRTHQSDGVCSSVLEALSLGVPVVASDNGHRPEGVITFPADDSETLAAVLENTLNRRDAIASALPAPALRDTVAEEVRLLTT